MEAFHMPVDQRPEGLAVARGRPGHEVFFA
jgi:hypothetical protein